MVIGEVALSTTLLIGAGLLIRSLYNMQQERLGFNTAGLVTFETPLAADRRDNVARQNFVRAMLDELQSVPGVRGVAATNVLPLTGQGNLPTERVGRADQSIGGMEIRHMTPAYFELMGVPVRHGRTFDTTRGDDAIPVAVINETVARAWFPDGSAIGQRPVIGRYKGKELLEDPPREIIGVVGDMKTVTFKDRPRPSVFVPFSQTATLPVSNLAWVVRTSVPGVAAQVRAAVLRVDSSQRVRRLRTMEDVVASTRAQSRFNALLFGIFAGVALAVAAIGVYGLLSFLVAQRRYEIGTRMALGARQADVLRLFFKQGLVYTAVGLSAGIGGALLLTMVVSVAV